MQVINRKPEEWLSLFYELQFLKEQYGSSIIFEAIIQPNIVTCTLQKYSFNEQEIISFLDVIKYIYSYERIIKKINQVIQDYEITDLAFIINGIDQKKEIIISKNSILYTSFNQYKTSMPLTCSKTRINLYSNREFLIVEENKRTLYTCDFRFIIEQLEIPKNNPILSRKK